MICSFKLFFFGAFAGDNTLETSDSAVKKTIETTKRTAAKMVKNNIKNLEISLFTRPPASRATLGLEIKLKQSVSMFDCTNLSFFMLANL